jgi:hypothetical protein
MFKKKKMVPFDVTSDGLTLQFWSYESFSFVEALVFEVSQ